MLERASGWKLYLPLLIILVLIFIYPVSTAFPEDGERLFHIVFSSSMIPDMNENDARASTEVFAKAMVRNRNIRSSPKTDVIKGVDLLKRALDTGRLDVVALPTDEFFLLESSGELVPEFVGIRGDRWKENFILLVHRESGIHNIGGLAGKRMVVFKGSSNGLSNIWLDTVLLENGFSEAKSFFQEVRYAGKLSRSILPVFFRQADACLVPLSGFETVVKLNPQVGRDLLILEKSKPLLPSLICIRRGLDDVRRKMSIDALESLGEESAGKQVLLLFKLDGLIRYSEHHITEARMLMDRYRRLKSVDNEISDRGR